MFLIALGTFLTILNHNNRWFLDWLNGWVLLAVPIRFKNSLCLYSGLDLDAIVRLLQQLQTISIVRTSLIWKNLNLWCWINNISFEFLWLFNKSHQMKWVVILHYRVLFLRLLLHLSHVLILLNLTLAPYLVLFKLVIIFIWLSALLTLLFLWFEFTGLLRASRGLFQFRSCWKLLWHAAPLRKFVIGATAAVRPVNRQVVPVLAWCTCHQWSTRRPLSRLLRRQEGHFDPLFVIIIWQQVYLHCIECLPRLAFEGVPRVERAVSYMLWGKHCVHVALHKLLFVGSTLPRSLRPIGFIPLFWTRFCVAVVTSQAIVVAIWNRRNRLQRFGCLLKVTCLVPRVRLLACSQSCELEIFNSRSSLWVLVSKFLHDILDGFRFGLSVITSVWSVAPLSSLPGSLWSALVAILWQRYGIVVISATTNTSTRCSRGTLDFSIRRLTIIRTIFFWKWLPNR